MQLNILSGVNWLSDDPVSTMPAWKPSPIMTVLSLASGLASAYHGSRRHNGSVGYGVLWGVLGAVFIGITPAIAVAQGFGKPMKEK